MNQEYFSIQLSPKVNLAIPLENMGPAIQLEVDSICIVPGVSDFWYGVVNFKGSLLWILDSDRYFNLKNKHTSPAKKLTAIIIKQQQKQSKKQVAIAAQKLEGIVDLEKNTLEESSNISANLKNCSVLNNILETKKTYILDPDNLLQQIHQHPALMNV